MKPGPSLKFSLKETSGKETQAKGRRLRLCPLAPMGKGIHRYSFVRIISRIQHCRQGPGRADL